MIRKRVLEALAKVEDWKIVDGHTIVREDGLTLYTKDKSDALFIASADHGVPQGYVSFDGDGELRTAWNEAVNLGMGTDPSRRPALKLLGVAW